ncbi:hypothetical protein [Maricaulis sp. CAU 1757]
MVRLLTVCLLAGLATACAGLGSALDDGDNPEWIEVRLAAPEAPANAPTSIPTTSFTASDAAAMDLAMQELLRKRAQLEAMTEAQLERARTLATEQFVERAMVRTADTDQ